MSKAVMLSIRPKWVEKIANGEKTIEVRKTKPKYEKTGYEEVWEGIFDNG